MNRTKKTTVQIADTVSEQTKAAERLLLMGRLVDIVTFLFFILVCMRSFFCVLVYLV